MKQYVAIFLAAVILFMPGAPGASGVRAFAEESAEVSTEEAAAGILAWKKAGAGLGAWEDLLSGPFTNGPGATDLDWYVIGMSRSGAEDDYGAYLEHLRGYVREQYKTENRLDRSRATEWHRIILAVLACGGDPTDMGTDENGARIDLVADGVYNRGKTASLGKQGVNGWIWGLIALDSMDYEVPQGAFDTRESILAAILAEQQADGGWSLSGQDSTPDLTAMALQALAPYQEQGEATAAVGRALEYLSQAQGASGGFGGWNGESVESADQVLVALCALGIDPLTDDRFIKNGHTVPDAVLAYRMEDGGFAHSWERDAENPSATPGESNSMAGEQTLYALAALWRFQNGKTPLYDFTDREKPAGEPSGMGTQAFLEKIAALSDPVTTGQGAAVEELLSAAERMEDFEGKAAYVARLETAKAEIAALREKIAALNEKIEETVYPLEDLTPYDLIAVGKLIPAYEALPEADRGQITDWDAVLAAKSLMEREFWMLAAILALALLNFIFLLAKLSGSPARQAKRRRGMDRLAARYEAENPENAEP